MRVFLTGAAGFIGSSIAAGLVRAGHQVTGLVRKPEQVAELATIGVQGIVGTLDDRELLIEQARAADAVINAASSDHRAAVEAIIEALAGSNKPFFHTSGSSIVGDASGGEGTQQIYFEDKLPAPTADKAALVAIDDLVLASANQGVRASVRHVGPGRNSWSNVHIDDVVSLYLLALEKSQAGTFYFVESGEAAFRDMTAAIADA